MQQKTLSGKTAIITGASAGIGEAVALTLASAGAAVLLNARRAERLAQLAQRIEKDQGAANVFAGDAADAAVARQLVEEAVRWRGRVDIVIVNAGRGLFGGLLGSDEKQWRELFELNVLGALELMRAAGERMVQQRSGDIVVLGSVAGHNISPFSGLYGSTKWAVASAAEAMRREVCGRGVRVTTIMPAVVLSEFQAVAGYTAENFGKSIERFGKLLEPQDVANAIAFVLQQPPHVHINELVIRPTGQDYP